MSTPRPLSNIPYEKLGWTGNFQYPDLCRMYTIGDGSCFFHAIAASYFKPYIEGISNGKRFDRRVFIKKLRKELAEALDRQPDPNNLKIAPPYSCLSRGNLLGMSRTYSKYSLKSMKEELNSTRPVDNMYNEYISNMLNKDIYILDMVSQDVYITGSDDDLLYKGRPSIVIGSLPGHYELIGAMVEGKIRTIFAPNHPLIEAIKTRMAHLRAERRTSVEQD